MIGLTFAVKAQSVKFKATSKEKKEEIILKVKDGKHPDVYIDGKKYDSEILDLLDQSKIESMSVLKEEQAIKEYNAPNGVILITTKKEASKTTLNGSATIAEAKPLIIIDGVVKDQNSLDTISPDDIQAINVIKGEKAIEHYQAPQGVIVITTKNKNKSKDQNKDKDKRKK